MNAASASLSDRLASSLPRPFFAHLVLVLAALVVSDRPASLRAVLSVVPLVLALSLAARSLLLLLVAVEVVALAVAVLCAALVLVAHTRWPAFAAVVAVLVHETVAHLPSWGRFVLLSAAALAAC